MEYVKLDQYDKVRMAIEINVGKAVQRNAFIYVLYNQVVLGYLTRPDYEKILADFNIEESESKQLIEGHVSLVNGDTSKFILNVDNKTLDLIDLVDVPYGSDIEEMTELLAKRYDIGYEHKLDGSIKPLELRIEEIDKGVIEDVDDIDYAVIVLCFILRIKCPHRGLNSILNAIYTINSFKKGSIHMYHSLSFDDIKHIDLSKDAFYMLHHIFSILEVK